jgi:hypothetical protein
MVIGGQGCPWILVIFVLAERKKVFLIFGDIVLVGRVGFSLKIFEVNKLTLLIFFVSYVFIIDL